jgi:ABC-2 type transport system permease protein
VAGQEVTLDEIKRNLKGAYTIWLRDLTRYARDRARILTSLAQPMLYLVIFGTGFSAMLRGGSANLGDVNFQVFMYPGIIGMTVMFTSIFSAISIVFDREFGFLKEVMVAPVSRVAVALGKVAGGSTVALIQGCIVLLLAPLLGVNFTFPQLLQLLGLMIVLAAVVTSLGILIAARQHSFEGFQFVINFLMMPMFLLSGALFPLTGLPAWMATLVRFNPVAYAMDALRQTALSGVAPAGVLEQLSLRSVSADVLYLFGFGMLFLVPAVWAFSRQD